MYYRIYTIYTTKNSLKVQIIGITEEKDFMKDLKTSRKSSISIKKQAGKLQRIEKPVVKVGQDYLHLLS